MTGNITWEMIAGLFGIIVAILGIWRRVEGKIKEAADTANLRALSAQTKAETIATDLSKYQIHVAETYASKAGVEVQFNAISKSITEFGDRVETRLTGMNERLDRVIEAGKSARSAN
jgi:hypothetical protein